MGHIAIMCHTGRRKVAAERFKRELARKAPGNSDSNLATQSTSSMEIDDTVMKLPPQAVSTPLKIETVVTGINLRTPPKNIEMPPQNIKMPTQASTSRATDAAIVTPPKLIPPKLTPVVIEAPTSHMIKSLPRIPRISESRQSPEILQS